ncbi:hypothetical protein [Larsenimonas suaedae]|uniref:Uncharacterized protein n=1 Tax=Larsenimonas suaedae TaxID=1851019 RepID=A0ABU1GVQ0_9GAMM|nr:hypothetical protein [Larsenimonas suaedae]MCM2971191.1 hypothetical protein [Larsenimonas suaedae]MDR5895900.1 hypothetical protein [Larsenimonas suaedae]
MNESRDAVELNQRVGQTFQSVRGHEWHGKHRSRLFWKSRQRCRRIVRNLKRKLVRALCSSLGLDENDLP